MPTVNTDVDNDVFGFIDLVIRFMAHQVKDQGHNKLQWRTILRRTLLLFCPDPDPEQAMIGKHCECLVSEISEGKFAQFWSQMYLGS